MRVRGTVCFLLVDRPLTLVFRGFGLSRSLSGPSKISKCLEHEAMSVLRVVYVEYVQEAGAMGNYILYC